jgi:ribosomal protein S18 acetylase RimI-like enzyme
MSDFEVRPATADDAPGIATVHVRSWQAAYVGQVPQDYLDAMDPVERVEGLRRRLEQGGRGSTLVAAKPDGTVIGFVGFGPCAAEPDDESLGEVYSIYAHPDHWSVGAGYAVMQAALRELIAQGRLEIRLWVLGTNERARRFYERVGFTLDGQTSVFRVERGSDPAVELDEVRYVFDGRTRVA